MAANFFPLTDPDSAAPSTKMSASNASTGNAFNLREIRESLALAEQLAKASMSKSSRLPSASADANNNHEDLPRAEHDVDGLREA